MKQGTWHRLDLTARSLTPTAITLLLIMLGMVPLQLPNIAPVVPSLALIGVFYWAVHRPDLMTIWAIFAIGLFQDLLSGGHVGVGILGSEEKDFWKDHKGAKINAIRTRTALEQADLVVVKFGEKYRQWNAAFDAGYAAALGKQLIILHPPEFNHALKEVDGAAQAVAETPEQVVALMRYVIDGALPGYTDQARAAE